MIENILLWTNTVAFGMVLAKEIAYDSKPKVAGCPEGERCDHGHRHDTVRHHRDHPREEPYGGSRPRYVDWWRPPPFCIRTGRSPERGLEGRTYPWLWRLSR
jgi:hypothetical protein